MCNSCNQKWNCQGSSDLPVLSVERLGWGAGGRGGSGVGHPCWGRVEHGQSRLLWRGHARRGRPFYPRHAQHGEPERTTRAWAWTDKTGFTAGRWNGGARWISNDIISLHDVDYNFFLFQIAGALSFANGRVNSSILDDSDEVKFTDWSQISTIIYFSLSQFHNLHIYSHFLNFRTCFNLDLPNSRPDTQYSTCAVSSENKMWTQSMLCIIYTSVCMRQCWNLLISRT